MLKKMRIITFLGLLSLVLTACGKHSNGAGLTSDKGSEELIYSVGTVTEQPSGTQSEEPSEPMSNESAIEAAKDIQNKLLMYSQNDYEEFAKLYRNTDEEIIKSDFNTEYNFDDYDKVNYGVVCSKDNFFLVHANYYLVTGVHPNTHTQSSSYAFIISYGNGGWKLEYNETLLNAINSLITDIYPVEMMEASSKGLNAIAFNSTNYMYLDETSVYEGCSNTEVKFAWQDADGNVYVTIWFVNGTDNAIYYTTCSFSLTDSKYGLICDVATDVNIALKSHRSKMYTVVIPASDVLTGKSTWSSVRSSCHIEFK